jgi:hypothetical protein
MKKLSINLFLRGIKGHALFSPSPVQTSSSFLLLKKLTISLLFILFAAHLQAQKTERFTYNFTEYTYDANPNHSENDTISPGVTNANDYLRLHPNSGDIRVYPRSNGKYNVMHLHGQMMMVHGF